MARDNEELRRRYSQLRELGYSSNEARRLRYQSDARISGRTQVDASRLRNESSLSSSDSERLDKLDSERSQTRGFSDESFESQRARRLANFQHWSNKNVGFPDAVLRDIESINTSSGRDIHSSYGYRVYYHRYVNDETPADAQLRAERRDT